MRWPEHWFSSFTCVSPRADSFRPFAVQESSSVTTVQHQPLAPLSQSNSSIIDDHALTRRILLFQCDKHPSFFQCSLRGLSFLAGTQLAYLFVLADYFFAHFHFFPLFTLKFFLPGTADHTPFYYLDHISLYLKKLQNFLKVGLSCNI